MATFDELDEARLKTYLSCEGGACPICGSTDLSGGSIDLEGGAVYQEVTCQACEAHWTDCYHLANVICLETADKDEQVA